MNTLLLFSIITSSFLSNTGNPNTTSAMIEELRQMVVDLQSEVSDLKNQDDAWLTAQRADQVRDLVHDMLADADTRSSLQGSGIAAG